MRQRARTAFHFAGTIGTLALLIGWLVWLRPVALGGSATYVLVRGDSMEPTYRNGDLVLLDRATAYGAGDIVGYRVPAGDIGAGQLVIHRIVGTLADGTFELRGDNNPSTDPWRPDAGDVAGVARASAPAIGALLAALTRPTVAAALALALLVVWAIMSGWFEARPRGGTESEARRR